MMQGTSPVVAGRNTSGGDFLKMIGSKNTMGSFEGWKPAGKEAILLSNPNFILITKRATKNYGSLNSFLKESGIEMTEAARTQNVFSLDGMSFLGFGPRTISSGLEISNRRFPSKPTTSLIVSANSLIVTSTPVPTFRCDCIGLVIDLNNSMCKLWTKRLASTISRI